MDEMVHVAYCLNDGFTIPTCVSMASMLANTKSKVCFHVVSNQLSNENKSKLAQLGEKFTNGSWIFHDLNIDKYKNKFVMHKNMHTTIEVYYRLFLHEVITDTKRLIYIDGDTVLCGDINELWCEDLKGKTIGAVKDIILRPVQKLNEILAFDVEHYYFNAGILLMDLEKYSKLIDFDTVFELTEALYEKFINGGMIWYADQDLLNYLASGEQHLTLLHAKYNLQQNDFDQYGTWNGYAQSCSSLSEWAKANAEPIIVHYAGPYKPWQLKNKFRYCDKYQLYFDYKRMTPFYDEKDALRIEVYEKKRKWTYEESLLPRVIYTSMFWPEIFTDVAHEVKAQIRNRKLVFWGSGIHIKHVVGTFALNGLFPSKIVDGFVSKQGSKVFEYIVESSEQLDGKASEYFAVISVETKTGCTTVVDILKSYGYTEKDYIVVYKETFDREEQQLI